MQIQEFRRKALTDLGKRGLDRETVKEALGRYTEHDSDGKTYRASDLQRVWETARGLSSWAGEGKSFWPARRARGVIEDERLVAALRDDVEVVRRELERRAEGDPDLPFEDYPDAIRWLEKTAERDLERADPLTDEERERLAAVREQLNALVEEYAGLVGARRWRYSASKDSLGYGKPGEDWVQRVRVPADSTLTPLVRFASRLTNGTGYSEPQVVAFVLADVELVEIPVMVSGGLPNGTRLPSGRWIYHREVQLTIRDPDLSFEDLRKLYNRVRERFGAKGQSRLNDKDLAIERSVRRRGGVPEEGKVAFWEEVKDEVNKRGDWPPYQDWRGPYQRWRDKIAPAVGEI